MHPIIIHRVATTAVLPLIAMGGWAGYTGYATPYQAPTLACTVFTTDIRPGSTAGEVSMLQRFLAAEGYLGALPTGYFGQATFTALTRFQADYGLPITGIADAQTRAIVQQVSCTSAPVQNPVYPTYQPQVYQTYPNSYQNTYPNPYPTSYPAQYPSAYPSGCHDYYDRACYVNGRYIGPSYDGSSTYNGTGDTCYYLNGQWNGACAANSYAGTGNSYYTNEYYDNSTYYQNYQQNYQTYTPPSGTIDYSCYYDRACLARMQGRAY